MLSLRPLSHKRRPWGAGGRAHRDFPWSNVYNLDERSPGLPDVLSLLPLPRSYIRRSGEFVLTGLPSVNLEGPSSDRMHRTVARLRRRLKHVTGYHAPCEQALNVRFRRGGGAHPALGDDESYRLRIGDAVELEAETEWGVVRGVETLLQLLERGGDGYRLAHCEIEDAPRFPWRGLMLDLSRHPLARDDVLRTLEGMAALKLNVLHLHLSDDQAFRLESRCHSRLASDGALSPEDAGAIVELAADLGIRVVPEVDMPGHVTCWLAAYPSLAAEQRRYRAARSFGIHRGALDPTREEVYGFLRELLAEVAARFPDPFLHVGGDEVHPRAWTGDHIAAFMDANDIDDQAGLQNHFNRRIAGILAELGRTPVGWDEILHPGLGSEWLVQAWRHVAQRDRAIDAGFDCVYSAGYYLDLNLPAGWHYRVDPEDTGEALEALDREMWSLPGLASLTDALGGLARAQSEGQALAAREPRGRVLGGEACMWSELVTGELLDRRVFSRLPAVAERLWSPKEVSDQNSFYARLPELWSHLARSTSIDLGASGRRLMSRLCASRAIGDFADLLEPIKWYRRHIGDAAIRARAEGTRLEDRPYDVRTPLNRLVDALLPESLRARRLSAIVGSLTHAPDDEKAIAELDRLAGEWRRTADEIRLHENAALGEVVRFVDLLPELAALVERKVALLEGATSKDAALTDDAEKVLNRAEVALDECELAIVQPLRVLFGLHA
jgi:hexosaminidase